MEKSNMDQFIQNPADNLRRWHGANCPCAKCQEAVENELCARIGANVMAEQAAINRMVESLHKPDLVDAKAPAADTRDDRAGEDDQDFQSDFTVQNY
jgi:hypothetical protein